MLATPDNEPAQSVNARRDGRLLFALGALVFLVLGLVLSHAIAAPGEDFRVLYYPVKCLLHGGDPYKAGDVLKTIAEDGTHYTKTDWKLEQISTRSIYPPSAYTFIVPFAMLPWPVAYTIWLVLTAGLMVGSSYLLWRTGGRAAPVLSGGMLALLLINSELIVMLCNAAGVVVCLGVIAVCCFLYERAPWLGVLCLATSISIKPHDTALVWLYFMLAGGTYRKRAWQTFLAAVALSLPCLLWLWTHTPHWMAEWHNNIEFLSTPGGISDPGPASLGGHGLGMVISLHAPLSLIRDVPVFYNLGSYLLCAPLVLAWMWITLRTRKATLEQAWLAIASIAIISLLPVYHRQYDAKMLLFAVPGCVVLCTRFPRFGRLARLMTAGAILFTGDLFWALLLGLLAIAPPPATTWMQWVSAIVQMVPAPLALLVAGVFFLWAYMRVSGCASNEQRSAA